VTAEDYASLHPARHDRRAGYLGHQGPPTIRLDLATDRGPVSIRVPTDAIGEATVISRVTLTANDSTVFSLPLYAHGTPLHTICTAEGIELGDFPMTLAGRDET
jgi:hypothetical protein